jgi:hypothetical protein
MKERVTGRAGIKPAIALGLLATHAVLGRGVVVHAAALSRRIISQMNKHGTVSPSQTAGTSRSGTGMFWDTQQLNIAFTK